MQRLAHLGNEAWRGESFRLRVDQMGIGLRREGVHRTDAVEQRFDGRLFEEEAGLSPDDGLESAAPAERKDRTARRLRLDGSNAEVFLAGQQEERCPRIQPRELFVRDGSEELDGGTGFPS